MQYEDIIRLKENTESNTQSQIRRENEQKQLVSTICNKLKQITVSCSTNSLKRLKTIRNFIDKA